MQKRLDKTEARVSERKLSILGKDFVQLWEGREAQNVVTYREFALLLFVVKTSILLFLLEMD